MSTITVRIGHGIEREEGTLISRCGRAIREKQAEDFFVVLPSRLKVERFRKHLLSCEGVEGIPGNPIGTLFSLVTRLLSNRHPPYRELPAGLRPFLIHEIFQEMIVRDPGVNRFEGSLPGLVSSISSAIVEFKEGLLSPEDLAEFSSSGRSHLLRSAARIYREYCERLERTGWMDREDLFLAAIRCLDRDGSPPDRLYHRITFHGFYDLNPLQFRLLESLSGVVDEIEIVLPVSGGMLDHPIPARFLDSLTERGAVIDRAEPGVGDGSASPAIELVEAPDPIREAEYVANRVKSLALEGRNRLGEIDVVYGRPAEYRRPLRRAFDRFGIPFGGLSGEPLSSNPSVRILISCLEAVSRGHERGSIINLLDSRYLEAGIWGDRHPGPALRDLIELARIIRGREEWNRRIEYLRAEISSGALWNPIPGSYRRNPLSATIARFRDRPEDLLEICDRISEFLRVLDEIPSSRTSRGYLEITFRLARRLDLVRGILRQSDEVFIAKDLAALRSFRRSMEAWESVLTGEDEVSLVRFLALLRSAIGSLRCPGDAGGGDLMVSDPLEKRHHSSNVTIVCGAREGAFSARSAHQEILGDEVRREINRWAGRDALPMITRSKEEEDLIFGLLLERTRELLVVTCPTLDTQSREVMPSRFIERFRDGDRIERFRLRPKDLVPGPDRIWDRKDLVRYLLPFRLDGRAVSIPPGNGGIMDEIEANLSDVARRSAIENERRQQRAVGYDGRMTAESVLNDLKERFGPDRVYTPSLLSTYITCPFLFLVDRVWRLEGREVREIGMSRSDRGNIIHRVLNLFYRRFLDDFSWDLIESRLPELRDLTADVLNEYFRIDYLGPSGLFDLEAGELQESLGEFVRRDIELSRELGATPILLEYAIHSEGEPAQIDTPTGVVRVGGRVDRVDALQSPEDGHLVMDYKTGYSPTIRDVLEGKSVQVPLYIIGLEKRGYHVLMGYYYHVQEGKRKSTMGQGRELFSERKSRYDTDWDTLRGVVEKVIGEVVSSILDGDFRTTPSECPDYCDLKGLCRVDPYRRKR